jgi:hypothetical protein
MSWLRCECYPYSWNASEEHYLDCFVGRLSIWKAMSLKAVVGMKERVNMESSLLLMADAIERTILAREDNAIHSPLSFVTQGP